jgi:hypothetical protein
MKKLVVALMVLTTLASCGKNNTVGSTVPSTNPLTVAGPIETSLGSIIDNNQFGTGLYYLSNGYRDTYKRFIETGANFTYKYSAAANVVTSNTSSNCTTILLIPICGYVTGYRSSTTGNLDPITRTVANSSVNLIDKQNELKAILNSRMLGGIQQVSYSVFIIVSNNGKTYIIDTALPIQANPVQQTNSAGAKEYLSIVVAN